MRDKAGKQRSNLPINFMLSIIMRPTNSTYYYSARYFYIENSYLYIHSTDGILRVIDVEDIKDMYITVRPIREQT